MTPQINGHKLSHSGLPSELFRSGSGHQRLNFSSPPDKTIRSSHSFRLRSRHSMKAINLCLLVCALLATVIGVVYILFDPIVKHIVLNRLVLRNNSEFARIWENPPITPHFKVYFFNLTNAEKFFDGKESPKVEEVGPYVYYQKWTKQDVQWHGNGTMSYRTRKDFTFVPELSVGNHASDRIVTLNVPVLSAMYQMRLSSYFSQYAIEAVVSLLSYRMWVKKSPEQLIWGYDEPLFDLAKLTLPNPPKLDRFGFFNKKNSTFDLPMYTMFTGEGNPYNLSKISLFDGEQSLKLWGRRPSKDLNKCNLVQGSDGATFNPYIQRDDTLWFFNDQLCQSMPLVYEEDIMSAGGLPGYRFVPRGDVFMTPKSEPANSCFCDGEPLCDHIGDGMFAVAKCQMQAPVVLSWPHFLHANSTFVNAIDGLRPDKERHGFYFDVQETTGTTLSAKARIQVNLAVLKLAAFTSLTKVNNTIVPILWFEEGLDELGSDLANVLATAVLYPPMYKNYILFVLVGLCVSIVVIGSVAVVRLCLNRTVLRVEKECEKLKTVKDILNDSFPHVTIIKKAAGVEVGRFANEEHCMKLLESDSSTPSSSTDSSRVPSASHSRNSSTGSTIKNSMAKGSPGTFDVVIVHDACIHEVPSSRALLDPDTKLPNV